MTTPEPRRPPTDDELIHLLGRALEDDEPLPLGAVEFAVGTFAWLDVDAELAELLHDTMSEEAVVLRDAAPVRLLVFQAGDITLDVEHGPEGLTGSVSPAARYRVDIHDGNGRAPAVLLTVLTDEAGMFELQRDLRGTFRFVVTRADDRVVVLSPWIIL